MKNIVGIFAYSTEENFKYLKLTDDDLDEVLDVTKNHLK